MRYYNMQSDQIASLHDRIKELEEINASSELALAAALDEIDEGRERERRLTWTGLVFAVVAMLAIMLWAGRC